MPNTLVHMLAQAPATKALFPGVDLRWILLGAIIPDIPWILRRSLTFAVPVDAGLVSLYASVQASFAFCVVLCLATALLTTRPRLIFFALMTAVVGHFLLDMIEIKPGNGVLWLIPFSADDASFSLIWPEHPLIYASTTLACIYALFLLTVRVRWQVRPRLFPSTLRFAAALTLLVIYLGLPLTLLEPDELADRRGRIGRTYEADRVPYRLRGSDAFVVGDTGEEIRIVGVGPVDARMVSLSGVFVDVDTVAVEAIHVSDTRFRDWSSVIGLLVIFLVWCRDSIYLIRDRWLSRNYG